MTTVLISLIIFVCILLILVVLVQNSKGGGLSSSFGGGASQMIGVKRTSDLLEKLTWGLAIALVVLSLGVNVMDTNNNDEIISPNSERARQEVITEPGTTTETTAPVQTAEPTDTAQ